MAFRAMLPRRHFLAVVARQRQRSSGAVVSDRVPVFSTLHDVGLLAASYGEQPSFGNRQEDGTWLWTTNAQRHEEAVNCRRAMAARGIGHGDRVAVISKNRDEWAATAYAGYGLGAIHVPMYEQMQPKEWEYIISDSGAKMIFVSREVCCVLVISARILFERGWILRSAAARGGWGLTGK